jgi:PEP-CTERM motif
VFVGDSLLLDAPPLSSFELTRFSVFGEVDGNQVEILGQIDSLQCTVNCVLGANNGAPVPEPASVWLLLSGISGIAGLKQRWSRKCK